MSDVELSGPGVGGADAPRAEIVVDLDAIADNVATLRGRVREEAANALMMTVVKADGYGHGLVESSRAARAGGADWLGVAVLEEALALRAAGDTGPILAWLAVPGEDYTGAVEDGVDLTAYTVEQVRGHRRGGPCGGASALGCSSRSTPA